MLQANCSKFPDCTTTILTKAIEHADIVLVQETWARRDTDGGGWKVIADANFDCNFDTGSLKIPRTSTAIRKSEVRTPLDQDRECGERPRGR